MNHASGAVAAMDPEAVQVGDAIRQRTERTVPASTSRWAPTFANDAL
jgi:hypothetical protein